MTTQKLILPKVYLSWSQRELWMKSQKEYIKRYFEGAEGFSSKYTAYGSKIGRAVESRDFFDLTDAEKKAVAQLPRQDNYEKKILSTDVGIYMPYPYLAYIDACSEDLSIIDEYKTGKTGWTQRKASNHGQIKDYALLVWKITGKIPLCRLFWIETNEDGQDLEATGRVERFEVQFTEEQLLDNEKRIAETVQEISAAYRKWQFADAKNLNLSDIDLFVQLQFQIKDLQTQADELKAIIERDLLANELESYDHESGTFGFMNRKTYTYPDEFAEQEKWFKVAKETFDTYKKDLEATLKPEIKKSLTFRAKY
jgi:hypothetical protein